MRKEYVIYILIWDVVCAVGRIVVTCGCMFYRWSCASPFCIGALFFLSQYQFIHVGVTMTITLYIFSLKGVMFSSLNIGIKEGTFWILSILKPGKSDSMAQVSKNVSSNKMALNLQLQWRWPGSVLFLWKLSPVF